MEPFPNSGHRKQEKHSGCCRQVWEWGVQPQLVPEGHRSVFSPMRKSTLLSKRSHHRTKE